MAKKEPSVTSSVHKLRHCNRHVSVKPLSKAVAEQLSDSHLVRKDVLKVTVSREVVGSNKFNTKLKRIRRRMLILIVLILAFSLVLLLSEYYFSALPEWFLAIWASVCDTLLSASIR